MTDETTPEVSLDHVAAAGDGALVVDVRESGEYAQGHVPGAVSMPMGQLPARMGELDVSVTVHVVCAAGNRSRAMTDVLRAAGFDARSVVGGTTAWAQSGRPLEVGGR